MITASVWQRVLWQTPLLMWGVIYAIIAVPMQDYLMLAGYSHSQLATVVLFATLVLTWQLRRWQRWPIDETTPGAIIDVDHALSRKWFCSCGLAERSRRNPPLGVGVVGRVFGLCRPTTMARCRIVG